MTYPLAAITLGLTATNFDVYDMGSLQNVASPYTEDIYFDYSLQGSGDYKYQVLSPPLNVTLIFIANA